MHLWQGDLSLGAGPVGARLARDSRAAVEQLNRVIVHRGQALLPQIEFSPQVGTAGLAWK